MSEVEAALGRIRHLVWERLANIGTLTIDEWSQVQADLAELDRLTAEVERVTGALTLACEEHARQTDCTMLPDQQRDFLHDRMKRAGAFGFSVDVSTATFVTYFTDLAAAKEATK